MFRALVLAHLLAAPAVAQAPFDELLAILRQDGSAAQVAAMDAFARRDDAAAAIAPLLARMRADSGSAVIGGVDTRRLERCTASPRVSAPRSLASCQAITNPPPGRAATSA